MATVCGASLALMDAGVPIKEPVAGIAMGLIKEGDDFSVLSDILGDDDKKLEGDEEKKDLDVIPDQKEPSEPEIEWLE